MPLVEFVGPVSFPALPQFAVANKLRVGETVDGIKVGWIGNNIRANFLKKVEEPVAAHEGRQHKLLVSETFDSAVITELGGDRRVEITFGRYWDFLRTADQTLWYVAYIRDVNRVLWAVRAYWVSGELRVEAHPLGNDYGWDAGDQFVSA